MSCHNPHCVHLRSDDMFPALACDLSPQLVMDCERFNQVILLVDNNDFSYFGRQDGGEDVCFKEQGSCQIPLSNNAAHFADLEACEGEGVCVVTYVQHSDGTCDGGITNYEQVIYECVNAGEIVITHLHRLSCKMSYVSMVYPCFL